MAECYRMALGNVASTDLRSEDLGRALGLQLSYSPMREVSEPMNGNGRV